MKITPKNIKTVWFSEQVWYLLFVYLKLWIRNSIIFEYISQNTFQALFEYAKQEEEGLVGYIILCALNNIVLLAVWGRENNLIEPLRNLFKYLLSKEFVDVLRLFVFCFCFCFYLNFLQYLTNLLHVNEGGHVVDVREWLLKCLNMW